MSSFPGHICSNDMFGRLSGFGAGDSQKIMLAMHAFILDGDGCPVRPGPHGTKAEPEATGGSTRRAGPGGRV